MKTLSNSQLHILNGGTEDKTCAYLAMAALACALSGNLPFFALTGTLFASACM